VIFCRYIATAHYLHQHLKARFPGVTVDVVTGELAPEERKARVAALGEADHRLLIATDCLSEGINLQQHFSAVVHYDLSWNPTRHEQREGRVDRFGQESARGARHAHVRPQQPHRCGGAQGHPAQGEEDSR
jgi:superfamily II DNA/RNA helicase